MDGAGTEFSGAIGDSPGREDSGGRCGSELGADARRGASPHGIGGLDHVRMEPSKGRIRAAD